MYCILRYVSWIKRSKVLKNELSWVAIARGLIGTAEKAGKDSNPKIVEMWRTAFGATGQTEQLKNAVWHTENTPWCGGFVGHVLAKAGLAHHIPKSFAMARSWLRVGTKLNKPAYGSIVVFWRGSPKGASGHVGIVVGKDRHGNLMVLGGNQGDSVNIKPFGKNRVLGYRWCGTQALPAEHRYELPLLQSNGQVSTNES